jgi:hypothetical protein
VPAKTKGVIADMESPMQNVKTRKIFFRIVAFNYIIYLQTVNKNFTEYDKGNKNK